jgi:hypothetical protein
LKGQVAETITWVIHVSRGGAYFPRHGGSSNLPAYRHYRLDGAGSISKAEWFEASDDADAVSQVESLKLPAASEIWQGSRRVARVEAADSV